MRKNYAFTLCSDNPSSSSQSQETSLKTSVQGISCGTIFNSKGLERTQMFTKRGWRVNQGMITWQSLKQLKKATSTPSAVTGVSGYNWNINNGNNYNGFKHTKCVWNHEFVKILGKKVSITFEGWKPSHLPHTPELLAMAPCCLESTDSLSDHCLIQTSLLADLHTTAISSKTQDDLTRLVERPSLTTSSCPCLLVFTQGWRNVSSCLVCTRGSEDGF